MKPKRSKSFLSVFLGGPRKRGTGNSAREMSKYHFPSRLHQPGGVHSEQPTSRKLVMVSALFLKLQNQMPFRSAVGASGT